VALDNTRCSTFLNDHLACDLLFRIVLWAIVVGISAYYLLRIDEISALAYFIAQTKTLTRVLNVVGLSAVFSGGFALMLKDLDFVNPIRYGFGSRFGFWTGWLRRLAGDVLLWSVGSFVSLLTVTLIAAISSTASNWKGIFTLVITYSFMIIFTLIMGSLSVLVRRAQPLFGNQVQNARYICIGYLVALVVIGSGVYLRNVQSAAASTLSQVQSKLFSLASNSETKR
jgi:hypothetical protein